MANRGPEDSGEDDRSRLQSLSQRIEQTQPDPDPSHAKPDNQDMSMGMRAGTELVSAIGAGALIGWFLDRTLDTAPIFLILFLLTGICTGFYGVYRINRNMGHAVGFSGLQTGEKPGTKPPKD